MGRRRLAAYGILLYHKAIWILFPLRRTLGGGKQNVAAGALLDAAAPRTGG